MYTNEIKPNGIRYRTIPKRNEMRETNKQTNEIIPYTQQQIVNEKKTENILKAVLCITAAD